MNTNLIFLGLVLAVIAWKLWDSQPLFSRNTKLADGPILASSHMLGSAGLTSVTTGNIAGYPFNLMTNWAGRVIVFVQLPSSTATHIVAYGDKSALGPLVKPRLAASYLEPADLEGNFPSFFKMYCSPSKQAALRQVFQPDTMAEFVDFCRAYDFELYKDSLYVTQAEGAGDADDETPVVTDLEHFLAQNGKALSRLEA